MHMQRNLAVILLALAATVSFGCLKETSTSKESTPKTESGGHEDHDHVTGPHGGHILELSDGGQGAAHAEWLHDDDAGIVTVFLREEDLSKAWTDAPADVSIVIRTGKDGDKTYTLAGVESLNDAPVEAAYTITDPALVTALQVIVEGKEPMLKAKRGDKEFTGIFEEHHHHH